MRQVSKYVGRSVYAEPASHRPCDKSSHEGASWRRSLIRSKPPKRPKRKTQSQASVQFFFPVFPLLYFFLFRLSDLLYTILPPSHTVVCLFPPLFPSLHQSMLWAGLSLLTISFILYFSFLPSSSSWVKKPWQNYKKLSHSWSFIFQKLFVFLLRRKGKSLINQWWVRGTK